MRGIRLVVIVQLSKEKKFKSYTKLFATLTTTPTTTATTITTTTHYTVSVRQQTKTHIFVRWKKK